MVLATLTRMWVKIGTQRQIQTDDNHDRCYGYTAIDWVSLKTHYRIAKDFNGREFKSFIEQLTGQYPDETIVIVLDNAKAHGYQRLHGEVKVNEQLYFIFFRLTPLPNSTRLRRCSVSSGQRSLTTNTSPIFPT